MAGLFKWRLVGHIRPSGDFGPAHWVLLKKHSNNIFFIAIFNIKIKLKLILKLEFNSATQTNVKGQI